MKTGIPKLDDYLDGGIPKGKNLVYFIHPGVEGTVFGLQTLYHNLKEGNPGILITSNADSIMLQQDFNDLGWEYEPGKLKIVDAYSALIGKQSNDAYAVSDPEDIDSLGSVVERVISEEPPGVLVFNSLSTIIDLCGEQETIEAVRRWNKLGMLHDHVMIYNFTAWPYSEDVINAIKTDAFNAVISVGGIAERVIYGQYFAVLKADWTKTTMKSLLFRIVRPGGIRLYIPKILVTGPFDAGKSTFVHALSTKAVSVDRMGTTVALDHGHVEYKGFSADIFGTPGQERFDPIVKLLSGEAMGILLVVDSTSRQDFVRAKQMLEITMSYGLPYVIVANKQDLPGAMAPDELRVQFNVPDDVPIVPAVASKKEGVMEAFETLVDKITRGI